MITPTLGLVQLVVRDLEVSTQWYRDVLGLTFVSESRDNGVFAVFEAAGLLLVLLEAQDDLPQAAPEGRVVSSNLHFQISGDPQEAFAALQAAGADVVEEWTISRDFETFYVHDPDGHRIEISRPTTEAGLAGLEETVERRSAP